MSTEKKGRGRPANKVNDLPATIVDSVTPDGMCFADFSSTDSKPVLSLRMTNRHLQLWAQNKKQDEGLSFTGQLNESIEGGIVMLNPTCTRIENRLAVKARKVKCEISKSKGRHRQEILDEPYNLFVLQNELESFSDIVEERVEALLRAEQWKLQVKQHKEEVTILLQDMAEDVLTFSAELQSAQISELSELTSTTNKGKQIDVVSPRQARRKIAQVATLSRQALWFAHSFGLQPEYVQFRRVSSESSLKVSLEASPSHEATPTKTQEDFDRVHQVLYLLDKFAVSDEVYHELQMLSSDLPPTHRVKQARKALNESVTFERLPPPFPGAYRSFQATLVEQLSNAMELDPDTFTEDSPIQVKLSGDGVRFSRTSNFILLSFSFPSLRSDALSGRGNHTVAVIKAEENYEALKSFKPVLDVFNKQIKQGSIEIKDKSYKLEFFLGGDYKYLLLLFGLNAPYSNYACLWCHIHRDNRWDMSKPLTEYNKNCARTQATLKKCSEMPPRPAKDRLGSQHPPLLEINPDHVILDELHLLLRVTDVLIRNLVFEMVRLDLQDKHRGNSTNTTHLEAFVASVRECGISFNVWEKREADRKPTGKYEWTSLMGKDKKKLLAALPSKLHQILPVDITDTVVQLWRDFEALYKSISSWSLTTEEKSTVHSKAKEWVQLFLTLSDRCEGHKKRNVTPYMHCMVYHAPDMIERLGSIKPFSGQGVEKNSDDARRNYRSSNHWDAAMEILKTEYRLEVGRERHERKKRQYRKQDSDYWFGGGIQEERKDRK